MKPNKDWSIEFLETFTKERKTKAGVKLSGIIWSVLGEEPELVLAFIQQLIEDTWAEAITQGNKVAEEMLNQQREEIREIAEKAIGKRQNKPKPLITDFKLGKNFERRMENARTTRNFLRKQQREALDKALTKLGSNPERKI